MFAADESYVFYFFNLITMSTFLSKLKPKRVARHAFVLKVYRKSRGVLVVARATQATGEADGQSRS